MQDHGVVRIGRERDELEVGVDADATLLNKRKYARMRAVGRPKRRWLPGAVVELNDARRAPRVLRREEDVINGRPRVVQEMRMAFEESGARRGSHIVHNGWRATVATPRHEYGMTDTADGNERGEIVFGDLTSAFPGDLFNFTTNHLGAM